MCLQLLLTENQLGEHFLQIYTFFNIIFKRKIHFIDKNQESTFRKFIRLAFADQDHCSFGQRSGENKGRCTVCHHAAINQYCEDLTNSLTQEKEWLWDACIFLIHMTHRRHESDRERVSYVLVKSPPARLLTLSLWVMNFKRFGFRLGKGWEHASKSQKCSHDRNIIYLSTIVKS